MFELPTSELALPESVRRHASVNTLSTRPGPHPFNAKAAAQAALSSLQFECRRGPRSKTYDIRPVYTPPSPSKTPARRGHFPNNLNGLNIL